MTTTATVLRRLRRAPAPLAGVAAAPSKGWSLSWMYFVFIVSAWCFVPLLRRLLDWHNGFYNPVQITSTIPYIVTLPLVFICFRPERIARMTSAFKMFAWVWFAVFAYGLIVALYVGNTNAALYEATQYLVPMLMGIWLAGDEIENPRLMGRISVVLMIFGGLVALYGLAQFVNPPAWDALWLQGGGYQSMGVAEPFRIRVFSTLNSAGPAGDFFAAVIILALPFFDLKRVWVWPFAGALGAALLLTLVRSSWIGLVVGCIAYLLMSPRRFRAIPFIAIFAALLVFLAASLPALLGAGGQSDLVTTRMQSLTDVDHDDSAITRTAEIQDAFEKALENPFGLGLGNIGSSAALSANPETPSGNNLDSGYMARLLELGWGGFAGYLFVVLGGVTAMIVGGIKRNKGRLTVNSEVMRTNIATAVALCVALVWADAAGDAHLGTEGFIFWIAMGIGFRRLPPGRDSSDLVDWKGVRTPSRREAAG